MTSACTHCCFCQHGVRRPARALSVSRVDGDILAVQLRSPEEQPAGSWSQQHLQIQRQGSLCFYCFYWSPLPTAVLPLMLCSFLKWFRVLQVKSPPAASHLTACSGAPWLHVLIDWLIDCRTMTQPLQRWMPISQTLRGVVRTASRGQEGWFCPTVGPPRQADPDWARSETEMVGHNTDVTEKQCGGFQWSTQLGQVQILSAHIWSVRILLYCWRSVCLYVCMSNTPVDPSGLSIMWSDNVKVVEC